MRYIECLRVPKVGELARLRNKYIETAYAIFRVASVAPGGRSINGVTVEVGAHAEQVYGWRVGRPFFTVWNDGNYDWEYHRLVPDEEAL